MPTFGTPGAVYQNAKLRFLGDGTRIDLQSDTINASLVAVSTGNYTPNDEHLYFNTAVLAGVPATGGTSLITATSAGTGGTKAITAVSTGAGTPGGAFYVDTNLTYFTSVSTATGANLIDGVAIWKEEGANDPLIAFVYLTAPVAGNTGDIQVNWSTAANRIFRI